MYNINVKNKTKEGENAVDRKQRIEAFTQIAGDHFSEDVISKLEDIGYFDAPASTKYHGSYEGGLFDHSYSVAKSLVLLTSSNGLSWQNERSPIVIGLLHDVCKVDQYRIIAPNTYKFVADTPLKGHGIKSVAIANSLIGLNGEEAACILNHMGAFGTKAETNAFTNAIHTYPNVLWTHMADMIASHICGV